MRYTIIECNCISQQPNPDRTFHSFKASKSAILAFEEHKIPRSTDFRALKLGNVRSGITAVAVSFAMGNTLRQRPFVQYGRTGWEEGL